MKNQPIGIFDSGLGGLTVVAQVIKHLPNEDIIYFGDTARIPYGSKSQEVVTRFSLQIARFLIEKQVKMIVVACNTASSFALPYLRRKLDVPVLGVIEPGAKAAVNATENGRIGIIGTEGTINSSSYERTLQKLSSNNKIFSKPCPLFVPLVEEGWLRNKVAYMIADEYLKQLISKNVDTLILGCTHYPLLKKAITDIMGHKVNLIDSATATAKEVAVILDKDGLRTQRKQRGRCQFFVSDSPRKFQQMGQRFLGRSLLWVKRINLEE